MSPDPGQQRNFASDRLSGLNENICRTFESAWKAWQSESWPRIEDYLPADASPETSRALLSELVMMDLEYRWRKISQEPEATQDFGGMWPLPAHPCLEDYLSHFPVLATSESLPDELIADEYWIRHLWGDRPDHEEYLSRFGPGHPALAEMLAEVDRELALRAQPSSSETASPTLGTRVRYFGDYELLEELGHGGMGVVYKARQQSLKRLVALKMIRSGQLPTDKEIQRFHTEAEAAASLQHPNIVAIHEVGEHEGLHYYSMDYVEGESLKAKIGGNPQPAHQSAQCVKTIAEAIDYAHKRGILHRDLKPANVLIDPAGQPRITDFGLAKRMEIDSGLTHTREILGTPSYMPPEQAEGRWSDVGPASDVYMLGAILYELLTGRPPFQGETPAATLSQVLHDEPLAPRLLNPKIPRDLETIALKCLEKETAARYSAAEALADDLGRFLRGEPIVARPISRLQHLWRWCLRKPGLASALAVAAGAVLVTLVILAVAVALIGRSRDKAINLADANAQLADDKAALARSEETLRKKEETNLYFSQIALADREWRANNVAEAEEILDSCPEALRHWEWYYLKRLCHSECFTIAAYPRAEYFALQAPRVTYSPDGAIIASGGPSADTAIWDAYTGTRILTLEGSSGWPAFSPDGKRVLAGDKRGLATEWDTATGKAVRGLSVRLGLCGLYSPDGKWIVSAADDCVKLLEGASGREESTFRFEGRVACLDFSPDSRAVAVAVNPWGSPKQPRSEIHVLDLKTRTLSRWLREDGILTCVAYSPNGKSLAVGRISEDPGVGDVTLLDSRTLHVVRTLVVDTRVDRPCRRCKSVVRTEARPVNVFGGPFFGVSHAVFSGSGKELACASWDGMTRILDLTSAQESAALRGQRDRGVSVAFSPDGKRIATSNSDGTIKVWEAASPEARPVRGFGCGGGVAFGADHTRLIAAAGAALSPVAAKDARGDGLLRVLDTSTGKILLRRAVLPVTVAISPDGKWFALRDRERESLLIQNTATGREAWTCALPIGGQHPYRTVAFSHDSRRLAVGTNLQGIRVFEAGTGRQRSCFQAGDVRCITFSPDDQRIAWGETNQAVSVLHAGSGRVLCTFRGHSAAVGCVSFSPDGKRVASTAELDYTGAEPARVWDAATGKEMLALAGDSEPIFWVAWSPDGKRLITAGLTTVKVWDATAGREILAIPVPGVSAVFSVDGRQILVDSPVRTDPSGHITYTSPRVLDARPQLQEERVAQLLVDSLFDEYLSARVVLDRIRDYPRCTEPVRKAALEWALSQVENPELMKWEAWQAVRSAGRSMNYYRTYRRRLQTLCRVYPERGDVRLAVGLAEYRVDDYRAAAETLALAERLLSKSPDGVPLECLAYLAMSQQKLGWAEEAQTRLDQIRGKWAPDDEFEDLLRAVEAIVPDPGKQELKLYGSRGHLGFHPDKSLLVGMDDGTIIRYDAEMKNVTAKYPSKLRGAANLAISPEGNRLAVARDESQIELLELPTGKSVCTIAVPGFKTAGAVFSPDGQRLAVIVRSKSIEDQNRGESPKEGCLRIHSAKDGSLLSAEQTPALFASGGLDWKSGLIAVTDTYDGNKWGLLLWDVERHAKVHHLVAETLSTAISPDGKQVAAGCRSSGDVLVWSTKTGKLLHRLKGHTYGPDCLAFSPDGRRLASGSSDSTVRVWNLETE